ncbi:MAG: aminotransferase class V-fold PLP-dependent enzyme [Bacteroidales bacterium]|nr:aminotransferase class V-fold PLP-dependent enzyme [Bacteroidales bacterium]
MTTGEFRDLFPILTRKVYGKNLVYFDNAATSQRPKSVLDKFLALSQESNANIYRAVHKLSAEATDAYEQAREAARTFVNAGSREEILFTSGCTAAINTVAYSFGQAFVKAGDIIVVGEGEHHSNLVPWQLLCGRTGASLRILPINDKGHWDLSVLKALLGEGCPVAAGHDVKVAAGSVTPDLLGGLAAPRVKLVAVTHISNVLGLVNPVEEVIGLCHAAGVPVLVDGAQGIVHERVDVQAMDCDFYAFSGHKVYAATGTGVLYGKKHWLEQMPPFLSGGEMVGTVTLEHADFAALPHKFEAGTGNFASIATFPEAFETALMARELEIADAYESVCAYLEEALRARGDVRLYGEAAALTDAAGATETASAAYRRTGVFSFTIDGVHHEDVAQVLDKMGIAVRSGLMCAEPVIRHFGVSGMVRASLAPYNTMEEAEYFIKCLDKAVNLLR